ncbi:MAG TPA: hypothetical protein VNY05_03215 [Candidatus Acidoferrales bacterium]|jgi:hypothetical protein|nr:hypothetical protein [Candidatus Acidoferrales bacterium]
MRLVVADTSPVCCLLILDHIDILARLLGKVFVPDAVHKELCQSTAPPRVREWATRVPDWVEVMTVGAVDDPALLSLGAGERAAIALALSLPADLVLIDERKGTTAALTRRHRRRHCDRTDAIACGHAEIRRSIPQALQERFRTRLSHGGQDGADQANSERRQVFDCFPPVRIHSPIPDTISAIRRLRASFTASIRSPKRRSAARISSPMRVMAEFVSAIFCVSWSICRCEFLRQLGDLPLRLPP